MTTIFLSCIIALSSLGFNSIIFISNVEGSDVDIQSVRNIRSDADNEPNNNIYEANKLNLLINNNSYLFGNFSPSDSVDWFEFDVTKGDQHGNNADKFYFP